MAWDGGKLNQVEVIFRSGIFRAKKNGMNIEQGLIGFDLVQLILGIVIG
jgi:hypothetical protein